MVDLHKKRRELEKHYIKDIVREVIKEELSVWVGDESYSFEEHGVIKRVQLRLNNESFSEDQD